MEGPLPGDLYCSRNELMSLIPDVHDNKTRNVADVYSSLSIVKKMKPMRL